MWFFWLCILNNSYFVTAGRQQENLFVSTLVLQRNSAFYRFLEPLENNLAWIPEEAFGAPKLSSICTRSYPRAQWAQARGEDSRRKKLLFLPSAYGHGLRTLAETAEEGKLPSCQELTAVFQIFW